MSNLALRNLIACLAIVAMIGCANKGSITGGEEDIEPPIITRTIPENYTTNFEGNEIYIYFNEYIKIKDLQKQLIISPPMDPRPEVTPLGAAKKFIKIVINDTLQPNTTYAFNFGQSIVDNNEGNPYSYYKYVFSTGDYIDSLSVRGEIFSADTREVADFVSVMLYEVDSTYNDSVVYKERPRYITNTLDSTTTFSLENLKAGKYKLVALKDVNANYTFEQKTDKIGFYDGVVSVPTDSVYNIKIFKEKFDSNITRPYHVSGQKIGFGFEGDYDDIDIEISEEKPTNFESRITKNSKTDTLFYWYKPNIERDTAFFAVRNKTYRDTLLHRFRDMELDSLIFNGINSGAIEFDQDFKVEANIPLVSINHDSIRVLDKDSVDVMFTTKYDSLANNYTFNFEKSEDQSYKLKMLPGAFKDFFGSTNDTLDFGLRTKSYSDLTNVGIKVNTSQYPIIVQLVNNNDEVKYEQIVDSPRPINFLNIVTGGYYMRVIIDANNNGKWDTGSYLNKTQPETIYYYDRFIDTRANFNYEEDFTLPQSRPDPLRN